MEVDEVKLCLRSLLSSTPLSCSLNTLLKSFKQTTGSELPLFGYSHPIEFLTTLDDTVQLFGDFFNPEVALVQSQKSTHITSLVNRQRISVAHRYPHLSSKPKRLIMPGKVNKLETGKKCSGGPPSQLKHSESFQKSSGFNNFETNKFLNSNSSHTEPRNNAQTVEFKIPSLMNNIKTTSPLKKDSKNIINSPPQQENNEEVQLTGNDSPNFEDVSDKESGFSMEERRNSCCTVNEGIKSKFKKIIKNYPNGLWCCELPVLFQEEYNYALDYREFGYTSLIQMVSELPDVFRCVRPGNEDWKLFDASVAPTPEENKMMTLQAAANVTSEVTANIKKLLSSCFESPSDGGIELDNLLKLYERMFDRELDLENTGFSDLKSFLRIWEGSLLNFVEVDGKTFVVPALKTTTQEYQSPIHWREAVPPITAENDIFAEIFPKEVVGPEEGLLELDLTRHIAVGHVVKVTVADVWSPGKFYVQLNKFRSRLSQFMDNMQKFYNVHLNKYKMPESTIRPNQICAGLYATDSEVPEEWYRAKILKIINDKLVLINLSDYGTITRIKKSQLRFLHRSFQSFPVQGFLAQLSGVAPVDGDTKWPLTTCKKFLELVRVPTLDAEMVDIDFKKPSLSVNLFYPSRDSGTCINRTLILERLACERESPSEELERLVTQQLTNTQKKVSHGNPSSASGNPNNNLGLTHEFSDITDLGQVPLFPFKTKCLKEEKPAPSKTETEENLKYEFEEVPDLEFNSKLKVLGKKENKIQMEKEIKQEVMTSEKDSKSATRVPEKPQYSKPLIPEPPPLSSTFSVPFTKMNRSPPGLERISLLPNLRDIQSLLNQNDLKRNINVLALELLATNSSIRQVGLINPALALKIATEMAEVAVLGTEAYGNLPLGVVNRPLINPFVSMYIPPQPLPSINFTPQILQTEMKPRKSPEPPATADKTDSKSEHEQPSRTKTEKELKYLKVIQINDKTVHLITINKQMYFCADEIVQKFTVLTNREIADRILRTNKVYQDYRILTKATDEAVLKEIRSSELHVVKKSKKLKVYLIAAERVVFFLQNLGCLDKNVENDFSKLINNLK